MQLLIYGELYTFIPIKDFRAAHNLPPEFSVALFEPKDYTGLGRIDGAGAELNAVRQNVVSMVAALAYPIDPSEWLDKAHMMRDFFRRQLERVNTSVGLREPEIDFAVSGFESVTEAVIWAMLRARATKSPVPTFDEIYADWLNTSVRISQTIHEFRYGDERWGVQMVNNAYGRVGMYIRGSDHVYCVYDPALACPAEGFMVGLLREVAARILPTTQE